MASRIFSPFANGPTAHSSQGPAGVGSRRGVVRHRPDTWEELPQSLTYLYLDALVRCFRSEHPGIFTGASAVVIEVQRTSIMKMVQAALFVTARMQAPTDAEIVCQSGLKKLDFGAQDMAELCGKRITTSTYAQRKQAAVTLCNSLLRYLPSFAENADAVQSFEGSKKKDDYGDSLLHCLAYASDHLYC